MFRRDIHTLVALHGALFLFLGSGCAQDNNPIDPNNHFINPPPAGPQVNNNPEVFWKNTNVVAGVPQSIDWNWITDISNIGITLYQNGNPASVQSRVIIACDSGFTDNYIYWDGNISPIDLKNGTIAYLATWDCDQGSIAFFSHYFNLTTSTSTSSSTDTGAIAGGVVGGVVGLAILILMAWCVWKRRRRTKPVGDKDPTGLERAQLHSEDIKLDRKELQGTQASAALLARRPTDLSEMPVNEEVVNRDKLKEMPSNELAGHEMEITENEMAVLDRMARMTDSTTLGSGNTYAGSSEGRPAL